MDHTIAAIATAPGVGAISVIRVSGATATEVISRCFSRHRKLLKHPRQAVMGQIVAEDGSSIDEVLTFYYPAPASFTGEHVVEISGHGGLYVTQAVLNRLLECGASAAMPGEFTQRAFLNSKLDLTQAEGIMDIISAQSDLALKAAQNQLMGSIQKVTQELRNTLISVTAHLEAYIDFPEDDIDPDTGESLILSLRTMISQCQELLSTSYTGKLLREGARVVLCGQPNAGKSSLLNNLLGYERAMVSDIKGTTRDTLEELVDIKGLPVKFIDTAGLRETDETLERQGVERARKEIDCADLVIELIDGTIAPSEVERATIAPHSRHLTVLNKGDLGFHKGWGEVDLEISCTEQESAQKVKDAIYASLLNGQSLTGSSLIAINARHQSCLQQLVQGLENAVAELQANTDPELIALSLREALQSIGELTGRIDTEEVLGEIFAQFCIGK